MKAPDMFNKYNITWDQYLWKIYQIHEIACSEVLLVAFEYSQTH